MGIYDLPAMIIFITNMRSQSLHTYIGHSMGAASFYIMASERPEIARMVQRMISLAPAAFMNHKKNPIRYVIPFQRKINMMQFFFHSAFLQSDFLRFLAKYVCHQNLAQQEFCGKVIFIMFGYDYKQINYALLPVILDHYPASSSTKTVFHYAQGIQSGKFRQYDYGRAKNLLIYNSVESPDYDLANITVPIALFYSNNDWFVSTEDMKKLSHLQPNVVDMYEVPKYNFYHMDFVWAEDQNSYTKDFSKS